MPRIDLASISKLTPLGYRGADVTEVEMVQEFADYSSRYYRASRWRSMGWMTGSGSLPLALPLVMIGMKLAPLRFVADLERLGVRVERGGIEETLGKQQVDLNRAIRRAAGGYSEHRP
jgi:hypothetical protein